MKLKKIIICRKVYFNLLSKINCRGKKKKEKNQFVKIVGVVACSQRQLFSFLFSQWITAHPLMAHQHTVWLLNTVSNPNYQLPPKKQRPVCCVICSFCRCGRSLVDQEVTPASAVSLKLCLMRQKHTHTHT